MTQLPEDELAALGVVFPGTNVLELGNKKNSTGLYRDWYQSNGLNYECVDWNGQDGAHRYDMTDPGIWMQIIYDVHPERERFPLVTNFGFTEHVGETIDEQLECWRNVHNLVAVGGRLAICMPMMPDWIGHGMWMPEMDWYHSFADLNEYDVLLAKRWDRKRRTIVMTLEKRKPVDFLPPLEDEILRSNV